MSNIPRRSQLPKRRSSSTDGFNMAMQNQQQQGQQFNSQYSLSQAKTPVMPGRASSIDGRSFASRASSIGGSTSLRPSIANYKDGKAINSSEIVNDVIRILQDLDYKQPISAKILALPSTSVFYSVFEFFLKYIGIEDVWNSDYLPANPTQKNANQISSSQPSQSQNVIAQNKARVELIIYYLEILKYNNVPKANVLQTMTTPKNWAHMLQIMQFLGNNCWFLVCYDPIKVLTSYESNFKAQQMIYEYAMRTFSLVQKDPSFLGSEQHVQIRDDFHLKYQKQMRGENNLKEMQNTRAAEAKKLQNALNLKEEFESAIKEEQETINLVNEEEKLLQNIRTENEERKKRIKMKRAANAELKKTLAKMEADLAKKDAEYDKQLESGKKIENLQNRHAQRANELEALQMHFVDLEQKKDQIQMQLMNKTEEVKEAVNSINEMVNKIKLSSSIELNEFPHFNLIDFHKKADLIKEYKDSLLEIRKNFNANICKLPEMLSQCKEEKKMIEVKLNLSKAKINDLENEISKKENYFMELQQNKEAMERTLKAQYSAKKREIELMEQDEAKHSEELNHMIKEYRRMEDNLKRIKEDQIVQIKMSSESLAKTEQEIHKRLQAYEKQAVEKMLLNGNKLAEMRNKIKSMTSLLI